MYLLLDSDVILRGSTLLLRLTEYQGGVYRSWPIYILTASDITEHAATGSLTSIVMLPNHVICRGSAHVLIASVMMRIGVLAISKWGYYYILHVVVNREVDCWFLHFDLLLRTSNTVSYRGLGTGLMSSSSSCGCKISNIWSVMGVLV